jgi:hypothetical protein
MMETNREARSHFGTLGMTRSALVLFSGGHDSTTCLAWALTRYDSRAVRHGVLDDGLGTREGGRLRRPQRALPPNDTILQLPASI